MSTMRHILRGMQICGMAALVCWLAGCGERQAPQSGIRSLQGAWMIVEMWMPEGFTVQLSDSAPMTSLLIFDGDSVLYNIDMRYGEQDISVTPRERNSYACVDRGHGDLLYVEEGHHYPLRFVNDTTLLYQKMGCRYTLVRAGGLAKANEQMILDIARSHDYSEDGTPERYVFTTREMRLQTANYTLIGLLALLALIVAAAVTYGLHVHRRNRRIRLRLRQIEEEHELRPAKMETALREVEGDLFRSDYYRSLQQRVGGGKPLHAEDWQEMERRLNATYPNFTHRLYELIHLSETELRVCMLIKLRIAPKDMATVLCKASNSISSIRSRLYGKVFHKKGAAADWDAFILEL